MSKMYGKSPNEEGMKSHLSSKFLRKPLTRGVTNLSDMESRRIYSSLIHGVSLGSQGINVGFEGLGGRLSSFMEGLSLRVGMGIGSVHRGLSNVGLMDLSFELLLLASDNAMLLEVIGESSLLIGLSLVESRQGFLFTFGILTKTLVKSNGGSNCNEGKELHFLFKFDCE